MVAAPATEPRLLAPAPAALDPGASSRASAIAALDRARLATTSISARDGSALDLRFGRDAVRIEVAAAGVSLRVDAGPQAVRGAFELGALADAIRARGVPVVRAELRGGASGGRERRARR